MFYRAENAARKAAGEEPLPEEDPANPIFKPVPEPSRLDSFLITNQMANYCNQINGYVINLRNMNRFSFCASSLKQGSLRIIFVTSFNIFHID